MYLAKFFHRSPGDDDRELLLIPGDDPMIIGFRMRGSVEIQTEDFLRERFSEIGKAVAAYRRHAAELVAAGYMETTHTSSAAAGLPARRCAKQGPRRPARHGPVRSFSGSAAESAAGSRRSPRAKGNHRWHRLARCFHAELARCLSRLRARAAA
jgi:hypothetical protein